MIEELISFLDSYAFYNTPQVFFTKAQFPDPCNIIYSKDGIQVRYCSKWDYIEILGLTTQQREQFCERTNTLPTGVYKEGTTGQVVDYWVDYYKTYPEEKC